MIGAARVLWTRSWKHHVRRALLWGCGLGLYWSLTLVRADSSLRHVPEIRRQHFKRFIPNDALFSEQWHLRNTNSIGTDAPVDIGVTSVWDRFRGQGILIAVVDDGVQYTHPDLAPNYLSSLGYDFNEQDSDPAPDPINLDYHGTAVAGIIAARANNQRGVAGVAFESQITAFRLIAYPSTDEEDADAMSRGNDVIHIKSNSWGAEDCPFAGASLEGPGPLMLQALRDGVAQGRQGLGCVYVWAGGNGGECEEDVNYDGYANRIEVIAVGAVSDQGTMVSYSEPGACLIGVAPSSGDDGTRSIVTTDLVGNAGYNKAGVAGEESDRSYTRTFSGTSAATPMVSGVVALMLQANPLLGYRDVQEILMRSARVLQSNDPGWNTNSGGIHHHPRLGAGLIRADGAVSLATNWTLLDVSQEITQSADRLPVDIPDGDPNGVVFEFPVTAPAFRIEHVVVTLTAPHDYWGDVEVTLIAPDGTKSALTTVHEADTDYGYQDWELSSVRHWGTHVDGVWRIRVSDPLPGSAGQITRLDVRWTGTTPAIHLNLDTKSSSVQIRAQSPAPGWGLVFEKSVDLTHWETLGQAVISDYGTALMEDVATLSASRVFYRARWSD